MGTGAIRKGGDRLKKVEKRWFKPLLSKHGSTPNQDLSNLLKISLNPFRPHACYVVELVTVH